MRFEVSMWMVAWDCLMFSLYKVRSMMMIVFTSGGVSTEYRPDRACHPHFSYGAAYEGF